MQQKEGCEDPDGGVSVKKKGPARLFDRTGPTDRETFPPRRVGLQNILG